MPGELPDQQEPVTPAAESLMGGDAAQVAETGTADGATTEELGELAVGGETPTSIPVTTYEDTVKGTAGNTDPATQEWREKNWEANPDRAAWMADKSQVGEMAATVADRAGRPAIAERLREKAGVEARQGAGDYDREQHHQAEGRAIELRIKERDRRAEEMRKQRLEEEIDGFVDKVLETVDLPPGNRVEILDQYAGLPAYEEKIDALYARLGLDRPAEDAKPDYSWDSSQGGPSHIVGKRQVSEQTIFRTSTGFGKDLVETRYLPSHQYSMSEQVRITVEDEKPKDQ